MVEPGKPCRVSQPPFYTLVASSGPKPLAPRHLRKDRSGNRPDDLVMRKSLPSTIKLWLSRKCKPPIVLPADAAKHLFQRLPQDQAAFAEQLHFLRPELDLVPGQAAAAADDGRHAEGHVANVVAAVLDGRDRQDAALIEGDRVDDVADGDADGETGAGLLLDDFRARALRAREEFIGQAVASSRDIFRAASRRCRRSTRSAPCCRRARPG